MSKHLQKAIENLMKRLIALSAKVEDSVQLALKSLEERDQDIVKRIIAIDEEVDREEIDIEEECLKILALHQPVAIDLRYIIAALKINNDLERIGDLALDIAKHADKIIAEPPLPESFDLSEIHAKTSNMLKTSLDSIINLKAEDAVAVLEGDDEVDDLCRDFGRMVLNHMKSDAEHSHILIQYIYISRRLERIADLATNIAEDVLYMIKGEIVRHGGEK